MEESNFSLDKFTREAIDFFLGVYKSVLLGLKNYWKYSVVIFLFFGLLFFLKSRKTETYYVSKATFNYNFAFKKIYGDLFYHLEVLARQGKKQALSQALGLSEEVARGIISISATNNMNSPLHEDFTMVRTLFYVHLECTNKDNVLAIQEALVSYIHSDTASSKLALNEINDYRKNLTFVNQDLKRVDSLMNKISFTEGTKTQELISFAKERRNDKVILENRLNDLNKITLVKAFQNIPVFKEDQLKKYGLKYGLTAVILYLLFSTFLQWYHNPTDEA